ncbi:hypothetical protein TWF481_006438 [Arthrobotrys musiformis]|uniref:Uncharacterized protein n=1 Tax=Arthrobotrys musiformis TaxID=47236 RepID=A0AAV9WME1_9PEZI
MSLTYAPTLATTDGCVPVCADYISCGQTYGGCFTSCPGVPTPEPTVPDYVISACIALGSTTVGTTAQPEYSNSVTVVEIPSAPTVTETTAETINTVGAETSVVTILTETTGFVTQISTQVPANATAVPSNETTTGFPTPTNGEPSAGDREIGAVKLGLMFGALIAAVIVGGFTA